MKAPSRSSSTAKRVHCGVNSVPPEKIPVIPALRIVVPRFSRPSASDSRSFGVVNMHFTSWPASRIVIAWSMQCCL